MADDERDENAELNEEEEEEWTEPADVAGLPDGPTTTFVGGFSSIKSIADGLARATHPGDDLVILPGTYDGDVALDTTKLRGVEVRGTAAAGRNDIVIRGRLVLEYSAPVAVAPRDAADAAGDEDGDAAKPTEPPRLLRISHLSFLGGGVYAAQTAADVEDVVFGTADRSVVADHTLAVHGFSTVATRRSTVFGTSKSAVYVFPHSRTTFDAVDIIGAETPPPPAAGERTVRKRGAALPPPPPPTTPTKCECEVGVFLDDGSAHFNGCSVRKFDIGVLANDTCPRSVIDKTSISLIATVGVLFGNKATTTLRDSTIKMCGREAMVLGAGAHPIARGNVLVGDVRLKAGCVATGVTDNVVGLSGNVVVEDETFRIKGFEVVPHDPTAPKVRKVPKPDA